MKQQPAVRLTDLTGPQARLVRALLAAEAASRQARAAA